MVQQDRFVLAKLGASRLAISTSELAHIVRGPKSHEWRGNGSVRAWCTFEGSLIWVLDPHVLFEGASKLISIDREWLLVLKAAGGLCRLGMFADDVKGPYGQDRIDGHLVVRSRTLQNI